MKVLFCHHSRLLADALAGMLGEVPGFETEGAVFDDPDRCSRVCKGDWDVVILGQVALRSHAADATCCHGGNTPYKRVLLGSATSVPRLVEAVHAGFDDLLDINISRDEMVDQLHELHAGRRSLRDHPLFAYTSVPVEAPPLKVPCRDQMDADMVALVARGLTDREIGEALYMAPQTVRNRLSRLMRAGGFRNRTEIALAHWTENQMMGVDDALRQGSIHIGTPSSAT